MTYSEFYRTLEKYTDETEFVLLDIKIKKSFFQGKYIYQYVTNEISYWVVDNFDSALQDEIEIKLYKESKKFIRQRKIKELLNEIL